MSSSVNPEVLEGIELVRFVHLSAGALIFYEYFITLSQEVEFIWIGSLSVGKGLFLVNRYYLLLAAIIDLYGLFPAVSSQTFCNVYYSWQGWSALFIGTIVQGILQLRIYALYREHRLVLWIMLIAWMVTFGLSTWFIQGMTSGISSSPERLGLTGIACLVNSLGNFTISFGLWITVLIFETLLSTLAILRSLQLRRSMKRHSRILHYPRAADTLIKTFMRDSLMYFLSIGLIYMTTMIMWLVAPRAFVEIPLLYAAALPSIVANRMVMGIRGTRSTAPKTLQSSSIYTTSLETRAAWKYQDGRSAIYSYLE